MRLNLGCGLKHLDGYINVDKAKECNPDQCVDLDKTPWPWADESVTEIQAHHVLEHLGPTSDDFIVIVKEMYRVLCDKGMVYIRVPHPRSDEFIGDPTHIRPITQGSMSLFSHKFLADIIARGGSNTPLGYYHDVDFEIIDSRYELKGDWSQLFKEATARDDNVALQKIAKAADELSNVVGEIRITLRKHKL